MGIQRTPPVLGGEELVHYSDRPKIKLEPLLEPGDSWPWNAVVCVNTWTSVACPKSSSSTAPLPPPCLLSLRFFDRHLAGLEIQQKDESQKMIRDSLAIQPWETTRAQ